MNRYGQSITWSTPGAPQPFTGTCTSWSYNDALQSYIDTDNVGDNRALVQHSRKAAISFDARVTDATTDFLDLSTGGAVAVEGIDTGTILVSRAEETWSLNNPKTASIQGTHFPDFTADGDITGVTAFQPDQSGLGFIHPGGKLIWGTSGITHIAGIVHMLKIIQERTITEDETDPSGVIKGASSHGYLRRINLDVLALTTGTVPANGSVLAIGGSTVARTANYRIESIETKFAEKRGKMLSVAALWIPPFN